MKLTFGESVGLLVERRWYVSVWESVLLETFKSRNGFELGSNFGRVTGLVDVVFEGSRVVREFFGYVETREQ